MKLYKVAIVGLGPKGLYAFERLLAQLHNRKGINAIEIHLFEKTGKFGAGEIYDPEQPEYLIMNYPNRNINVWPDENPRPLVSEVLSFVEWLRKYKNRTEGDLPHGFAPRRLVGKYLTYCFDLLLDHKKDAIKVYQHAAEVSDVKEDAGALLLNYRINGNQSSSDLEVDEIMLTTGHSSCKGKLRELENSQESADLNFISFVYPVDKKLSHIREKCTVGIKGLGLTFIDTVLALTEGRGGEFETLETGNLIYRLSGNEPNKIFAFSRSGLSMIPRKGMEGHGSYRPLYFTNKNIRKRAGADKKISYREHVLPLFTAEMKYQYYSIVFEQQDLNFYPVMDLKELNKQIEAFHEKYPKIYRFNFADFFKSKPFSEPSAELGSLAYLRYLIKEAEIASESSAFMAAAMTWGKLSEIFNTIYKFGGMTADSQHIFDAKYRTTLNRISYGPPLRNMKKIMALVETGIVNLDFAENPTVKKLENGWGIYNSQLKFQKVHTLIDARIPTIKTAEDWSPLLKNMRKSKLLRPFKIEGVPSYEVGCPEIDREGRAIGPNGTPITNISFYGTPTEGMVYDNDSLSRTRNNFASQWALNVLKNSTARHPKLQNENT